MKLSNYYRKAVIYPSIFILIFNIVYPVIENVKNDWITLQSDLIMSVITSAIYCLIMCLLSLSIFLNKWNRENLFWNIITWFFPSSGYILLVLLFEINTRIGFGLGFGRDFIYLLIMIMPFGIGLFTTFKQYRRTIELATIN